MKSLPPQNVFSCITVRGLVFDKSHVAVDQTLHRGIVKPGQQTFEGFRRLKRPGGMPARPESMLPPPGDVHLIISLGEKLGSGRAGTVYSVNVVSPDDINLPPLAIKISRPKRSVNMAQEAWFYEELEQLQGIAVARCYGFFQARLDEGRDVPSTRDEHDADNDSESSDEEAECLNDPKHKPLWEIWADAIPLDPYAPKLEFDEVELPDPKKEREDYENSIPGEGRILSILLLERLGSHMPIGEPLDSIQNDVYDIFDDLAQLGIEPLDIRYANIISVREGDDTSIVCPNHGRAHNWRLLDFDVARKIDSTVSRINNATASWPRGSFRRLVEGFIIEPWDI